jgi:pyridoxine/pyridoxamine 5'-phosphate oxidase
MSRQQLVEFLSRHGLAVIATTHDDGRPQAAVIEIGQSPDGELIFDTMMSSRKYHHLLTRPQVALVIGWDDDQTVQIEGEAVKLDGAEAAAYKDWYLAKHPKARKWADSPTVAWFKVSPTWARFTDVGQHPWQIEEIEL